MLEVGATILDKTGLGVKNRTAQLRLVLGLRFFPPKEKSKTSRYTKPVRGVVCNHHVSSLRC
jgi:hypothetical protein